ncbi:thiopeptide-type bacteriocin biosynthesis protein [Patescibacteria group bacterium]|nr:thiopeptide-type bacteriocin biosynthesis protein [Patescibacteria group bacterium]
MAKRSKAYPRYEPCDFLAVRAPMLPVDVYFSLSNAAELRSLAARPDIRRALAIGSPDLEAALDKWLRSEKQDAHLESRLLRFLIRMSTRPTPYGLFAGVALAHWGKTDISLSEAGFSTRTRPDMEWLLGFVRELEERPEIRASLSYFVNPGVGVRDGRVYLSEKSLLADSAEPTAVSMRANAAVQSILDVAREPIPYRTLLEHLQKRFPRLGMDRGREILDALWRESVLLSELRPSLTRDDVAQRLADRMEQLPLLSDVAARFRRWLDAMASWDLSDEKPIVEYRKLSAEAAAICKTGSANPIQVDMRLSLGGKNVSRSIGDDAARAAEFLLQQMPRGYEDPVIGPYRHAFIAKYGEGPGVPLLELLHPDYGLGPPTHDANAAQGIYERNRAANGARDKFLSQLALNALRDGKMVIDLDREAQELLRGGPGDPESYPPSLDLFVSVAADSIAAVERGEYKVVVAPHAGSPGAGKNLGRFADLLGKEARRALEDVASCESRLLPGRIFAELTYMPRKLRSANVSIRPLVRSHEILWGVQPGGGWERVVPLDELIVGVEKGRFFIHWPRANSDIAICAGHLLNNSRAPIVVRALAEMSRDKMAHPSSFQWGSAAQLPVLPRVQIGRVVLAPAQWRLTREFLANPGEWRKRWAVPRYVYVVENDNRLILDLDDPQQYRELEDELKGLPVNGRVTLQEVFPAFNHAWVMGARGRYFSEFVVSLVRQKSLTARELAASGGGTDARTRRLVSPRVSNQERLRPPGSDWLFAKLYGDAEGEESLIANVLGPFAAEMVRSGYAEGWHYLRYNDPEPHVRLRFKGKPETLSGVVVPRLFRLAQDLIEKKERRSLVVDAYDREIERYGGVVGLAEVEKIFFVDSVTAAELIRLKQSGEMKMPLLHLATLSIDSFLGGLGIPDQEKIHWCREYGLPRDAGSAEYRKGQRELLKVFERLLVGVPDAECGKVAKIFRDRHGKISEVVSQLQAHERDGRLTRSLREISHSVIHIHCNRLLGADRVAEQAAEGLLVRMRLSLGSRSRR